MTLVSALTTVETQSLFSNVSLSLLTQIAITMWPGPSGGTYQSGLFPREKEHPDGDT